MAYDELAAFLRDELAPVASEHDAVGRELYALHSRRFLGAEIDLDETYEWGVAELARMVEVQRAYELGQSFLEQEDQRIRMTITSLTR